MEGDSRELTSDIRSVPYTEYQTSEIQVVPKNKIKPVTGCPTIKMRQVIYRVPHKVNIRPVKYRVLHNKDDTSYIQHAPQLIFDQ